MTASSLPPADRLDREGWLFCAGYGAVVTVVLSVLPFSSLAGGAIAAFRLRRGYPRGLAVGVLAGVFAAAPLAVLFVPAVLIAGRLGLGIPPSSPAYGVFLALVGLLFVLYTVGGSALGGLAGVWIRRHTDREFDPTAWL